MDDTSNTTDVASLENVWWAATLAEGRLVYLPPARPATEQPGTLQEQLWVIDCYLNDPDPDRAAAHERARRLSIHHARRAQ